MSEVSRSKTNISKRTGPIGRLARMILAVVYVVSLASISGPEPSARFRNPHILGEFLPWILHAVILLTFILIAGAIGFAFGGSAARRRWQIGAIVVAVASAVVAEVATLAIHGTGWGFPLADLVWWFDATMLTLGLIANLMAVGIGLPGCEIGVWPWFISRLRGTAALPEEGLACVVGLHYLDAWEARRLAS